MSDIDAEENFIIFDFANNNERKEHAIKYISGFVERQLLRQLTCETCIYLLSKCTVIKSAFIDKKSCGYLHYPREDTYKVIIAADKVFNLYKLQNYLYEKNAFNQIILKTMRNINMDKLFLNFNNHVNELDIFENHKYYLIKLIIEKYIKILMNYEGKLRSQNIEYIRHQFTKLILFKGQ